MYYSTIPTKLNRKDYKNKQDWIKARTQELYDMLPQTTLKERNSHTDIRDEIIELNYSFFGYIAKNKYVTDPTVTYEDKLQVALISFCDMWAKYKYAPQYSPDLEFDENSSYVKDDYIFYENNLYRCKAEEVFPGDWNKSDWTKVKRYRTDLSFAVFFKPRLSECVRRELNIIKYTLRRQICMKAGKQLGKPWTKVTKEDISQVRLPQQEMQVLEAIFATQYDNTYEEDTAKRTKSVQSFDFVVPYGIEGIYNEQYDDLEDLIVHEMIDQESKLDDAYLLKMSNMYGIPFCDLEKARPRGEQKLKHQLEEYLDIKDSFESGIGFETDLDTNE